MDGSTGVGGTEIFVGSGLGSWLIYSLSVTSAALHVFGLLLLPLDFCCVESTGFQVLGSGQVGQALAAWEFGGTGVSDSLSLLWEGLGALRFGIVIVAEDQQVGVGGTGSFSLGSIGKLVGSLPSETISLPVKLVGHARMAGSHGVLVTGSSMLVIGMGLSVTGTLATMILLLGSSV